MNPSENVLFNLSLFLHTNKKNNNTIMIHHSNDAKGISQKKELKTIWCHCSQENRLICAMKDTSDNVETHEFPGIVGCRPDRSKFFDNAFLTRKKLEITYDNGNGNIVLK